jgi:hypothetical protein
MKNSTALIGTVWYGQLGREKGPSPFSREGKQQLLPFSISVNPTESWDS